MSKSRGNVVNPDEIVKEHGADTLRLYEMFIGDFEKAAPWSSASIRGCRRFLERVWSLSENIIPGDGLRSQTEAAFHKTIKKVSEDIENLKYNTAIAALMALLNTVTDLGGVTREEYRVLLILLNPMIAKKMLRSLLPKIRKRLLPKNPKQRKNPLKMKPNPRMKLRLKQKLSQKKLGNPQKSYLKKCLRKLSKAMATP